VCARNQLAQDKSMTDSCFWLDHHTFLFHQRPHDCFDARVARRFLRVFQVSQESVRNRVCEKEERLFV
jgi:hypothetical protein